MQCERCNMNIARGEERNLYNQVLCEECYMDLLSPAKACDPWAVYSAKTFLKNDSSGLGLTRVQQRLLEILQEEGPQERTDLCERLQLKEADLERELATLRHMEKIRGELRGGKRLICLW